jgi:hypothetical protein
VRRGGRKSQQSSQQFGLIVSKIVPSRRVSCPSECTTDDLQLCDKLGFLGNGQDDSGSPYGSEGWGFESLRAHQIVTAFSLVIR